MKYSLYRILINLRKHYLIYSVIMLTFMVGTGFFIICMNFRRTSNELLKESKQLSSEIPAAIIAYNTLPAEELELLPADEQFPLPISYETYRILSEKEEYMSELEILFAINFTCVIFVNQKSEALAYGPRIYYVNESLFYYLFGFSQAKETAYIGDYAYQTLRKINEILSNDDKAAAIYPFVEAGINDSEFMIDGRVYPFETVNPLEGKEKMPDNLGIEGDEIRNGIFLPVEDAMIPVSKQPGLNMTSYNIFSLRYRNNEWREDLAAKMIRELNHTGTGHYYFEIGNEYLELKSRMEDARYDMERWMLLAVSIIILSGISCIGAMFYFLEKRRHFLAVSLACGSTLKKILIETYLEIFAVLLAGGILGLLMTPIFSRAIVYTDELRINISGIFFLLIVMGIFSLLSVLFGMYAIKVKEVIITLNNDC